METPLTNPAASGTAVPGEPGKLSGPARHRLIVLAMTLGALVLAWVNMAFISADDPWYRNTEMNIHNMADALAINAGQSPNTVDQPGLPTKFLLALDYRLRHELGLLPVWNLHQFGASPDPLREIPTLIHIARVHSRILVLLVILTAAGLTYVVTRELDSACLSVLLLCGSSGLLFHGLLIRPELLCVGIGNVLVLLCVWRATGADDWRTKHAWLFAAGLLGGIAAFEKLPGICFLALGYTWCWLAAMMEPRGNPGAGRGDGNPGFWRGGAAAVAGTLVLLLLFQLKDLHENLGPVVVQRLRVIAVVVALLPLLALRPATRWLGRFLIERGHELACLAAGALASIPLSYLLLRTVMNEQAASTYVARILHFLVNPTPSMKLFLATEPEIGRQFLAFLKESPVLLFCAVAGVIGVCLVRVVSLRLKAFSLLLLAGALGITLLMSRRFFADQYSIFLQVPLLLALSLSIAGFGAWWRQRQATVGVHWTTPLVLTAALVLTLTVYARLKPKYTHYQDDVTLPVRDLTLTFIFDHDAHPATYLQIMRDRYGSRKEFAATLEAFLADSAPRK